MLSFKRTPLSLVLVFVSTVALLGQQPPAETSTDIAKTKTLQRLDNCQFVETDWCDGDSFRVQDATGREFTIRLYAVDCLETRADDDSDARRLRKQRRYFGISKFGGNARSSVQAAKEMGVEARKFVIETLKGNKFSVITAFADGRGSTKHKRYYAFVKTADGKDLASLLVEQGHARAFGVYRSTIDGTSAKEYELSLQDLEFQAAKKGRGIWRATDWDSLPDERRVERADAEELAAAKGNKLGTDEVFNVNTASRDELMRLPGIGEAMANRIIEGRDYESLESLIEVNGIGKKTLEKIKPHLSID